MMMWSKTRFSKGLLLAACALVLLGGLALATLVGSVGRLAPGSSALAIDPPHLAVDKWASSQACETASIHLQVRGEGTPIEERIPVDVMLVLDRSGSMGQGGTPTPLYYAKQAAKALVDQLDPTLDQVGLVSYADWASLDHQLTSGVSGFNSVKTAIDGLSAYGFTNIGDGVYDAQQELQSGRHNPDAVPVIVLLTDGIANRTHAGASCTDSWPTSPNACTNDAINQAATAKANGTIIFTVGLNLVWDSYPGAGPLARSVLTEMASEPDYYFETTDPAELEGIFEQIANILILIAGKDVVVTEILPPNLHYVSGSAVPAPANVVGQTLTWLLPIVSIGDVYDFYLDVTVDPPAGLVLADVYPDSRVDYKDYQGDLQSLPFPETFVYVEPCAYPELSIDKAVSSNTASPGDLLTYTVTVTNSGGADATNVTIEDDYDQTYLDITDTGGAADDGDKLTWNGGIVVPAGGNVQKTYEAKVMGEAAFECGDTPVENTAAAFEGEKFVGDDKELVTVTKECVDLKILDQYVACLDVDGDAACTAGESVPQVIPVSEEVTIIVAKTVHNNGPHDVDYGETTGTITVPPDCEILSSAEHVEQINPMPVSVNIPVVEESFTIHCSQPSEHTFEFDNVIAPKDPRVIDLDPSNNTAHTVWMVPAVAEADVKIVDQFFLDPPEEINVSEDTPVTLRKVLHNNGPYPGDVAVTLEKAVSEPPDCTMIPAGFSVSCHDEQIVLPHSVDVIVDEYFTIHCSGASSHTFRVDNSVGGPKEPHVVDPDSSNNSESTELTVAAISRVDLKILDQYVACEDVNGDTACTGDESVPQEIPVSEDVSIIVAKTVHNNGPYDVVGARTTGVATAPADCEVLNPEHVQQISNIPVSVDVTIKEPFTIRCSQPSEHTFEFDNVIETKAPHVVDIDPSSDMFHSEWTVPVIAQADLKIVDQRTVDWPGNIDVSEDAVVTLETDVHNNGPYGPVEAEFEGWIEPPTDCTVAPDPISQQIELAAGEMKTVQQEFTIHCSDRCLHTFRFHNRITFEVPHVEDSQPDNNEASRLLPSVHVWAEADVKIVDQYFFQPPTEIDVSEDTPVTLRKILHNNGPYAGSVTVTLSNTVTEPEDCTMIPVVGTTNFDRQVVLPESVDVPVDEDFIIHCENPSEHTFEVENTVSGPDELHVRDSNETNNSDSTELTVKAIAEADLKVTAISVTGPTEIDVSETETFTVSLTLHNNGPYGPVTVLAPALNVVPPADCTAELLDCLRLVELPAGSSETAECSLEVHCENPSTHTFEVEGFVDGPVEAHVVDSDDSNDSDSKSFTVEAFTETDVKVVGVEVDGPVEMPVSEDTSITVSTTLHNNGPYGPVEVGLSYSANYPADCSVATVGPPQLVLPVSVDVVDDHTWDIHCSEPSEHSFSFEVDIVTIKEPHVRDSDETNNSDSAGYTTAAIAEADLKVTAISVTGPAEIDVSETETFTVSLTLHNNGPYGPVSVIAPALNVASPDDCTAELLPCLRLVDLPAGGSETAECSLEVHCENPSTHTFEVEGFVDQPVEAHVVDSDDSNDSDSTSFTVEAIAEADVKVVGVEVDGPAEIAVSEDASITVSATLHNNGPYGPVEVGLGYSWNAPEDCDVATVGPLQMALPVSVDVVDEHTWSIHCSEPSEHSFSFEVSIVTIKDAHVRDSDETNNSDSAGYTTAAIADADVKIVDQELLAGDCASEVPSDIDVDEDVDLCLRKTLHNNGDYGPVEVSLGASASAPTDCTAIADEDNPSSVSLPVSTDVVVEELWTINCSEPCEHSFSFDNDIDITTPHVEDSLLESNSAVTGFTVNVWTEADVEITSQIIVSPPSELPPNQDVDVTLRKLIRNNGPYGPVDISISSSATASADCTVTPSSQNPPDETDVAVGEERTVDEVWTLKCSKVGDYTFTFTNDISVDAPEHVEGSDSAETELRVTLESTPTPTPTPTPGVTPTPTPVTPVVLPTVAAPTPTVAPPTPTVVPPTPTAASATVTPSDFPPTGGSGIKLLTTTWPALAFLAGAMALMLAGMGSAAWALRRRNR